MNYRELLIGMRKMSYRDLQKELRQSKEIGLTQVKLNSKREVLENEYERLMFKENFKEQIENNKFLKPTFDDQVENSKSPKPTFDDQVKTFAEIIGTTANEVYQLMCDPIPLQEAIEIISYDLEIDPYQLQGEIEDTFQICDLDSYLDAEDVDLHYFLREMAGMTDKEVTAECEANNAIIYAEIAKAYGIAA